MLVSHRLSRDPTTSMNSRFSTPRTFPLASAFRSSAFRFSHRFVSLSSYLSLIGSRGNFSTYRGRTASDDTRFLHKGRLHVPAGSCIRERIWTGMVSTKYDSLLLNAELAVRRESQQHQPRVILRKVNVFDLAIRGTLLKMSREGSGRNVTNEVDVRHGRGPPRTQ